MEEEEGTEAVFREGMNAVLKEQATSKNNVSNEGNILLYTKEEKKLYEKNPPSDFPPSSNSEHHHQCAYKACSPMMARYHQQKAQLSHADTNNIDDNKIVKEIDSENIENCHPLNKKGATFAEGQECTYKACSPMMARYQQQKAQLSHATTNKIDDNEIVVKEIDSENIENSHPLLNKGVIYAEGQEAVWHEDECTTVSSVCIQSEKKKKKDDVTTSASIITSHCSRQQPHRNRINIPFFSNRGKKHQQSQRQHQQQISKQKSSPVKIRTKKKKISKAILLLPPNQVVAVGSTATTDSDEKIVEEEEITVAETNETYAAITANTMQARRLLDTVLSGDIIDEKESEQTTKAAFTHAATARRLAHRSCQEVTTVRHSTEYNDDDNDNDKDSDNDNDNDNEEMEELEQVMSYLAEEGEQAVLNHMKHVIQDADRDDEEMVTSSLKCDVPNNEQKKSRRGKFVVSGYATRAVHYLESIIPKGIGHGTNGEKEFNDDAQLHYNFSSSDDFWSDSGISTLGLKNDTLEYGLSSVTDDLKNPLAQDGAGLLPNIDMMSLSSLNRILDENATIDNNGSNIKKQQQQKEEALRRTIPEINVPNKQKKCVLPPTKAKCARGILGRMTPRLMYTHQKDQSNTATAEKKRWGGLFKTPRENEGIPSKLLLVIEEPEQEDSSSSSSSSSFTPEAVVLSSTDDNKLTNGSVAHDGNDEIAMDGRALVEAEPDSHLGINNSNRCIPSAVPEEEKRERGTIDQYRSIPKKNEIELKLSVSTAASEIQDYDDKKDNDQSFEKKQTPFSLQIVANVDHSDCAQRNNSSESSASSSNNNLCTDRYKTHKAQRLVKIARNNKPELELKENLGSKNEEEEKVTKKDQVVPNEPVVIELKSKKELIDTNNNELEVMELSTSRVEKETEQIVKKSNTKVGNDKYRVTAQGNERKHQEGKPAENFDVQRDSVEEVMSTSASEGSKSKIFGRIVDMIGQNKRRAPIPNAITEETYIVNDKNSKSAMMNITPSVKLAKYNGENVETSEEERKCVHNVSNKTNRITDLKKLTSPKFDTDILAHEKNIQRQIVRKPTVCQRAKEISKKKKQSKSSGRTTTIEESTVVVEKAIAHGNLKAVESNLDEDDVPSNYLTIMLKKKLKEEKTCGHSNPESTVVKEGHQQQRQFSKPDTDSFVAAIRGTRLQEAPGVAFEEIVIRICASDRDPVIGNDNNIIRADLAPTPRHSDNIVTSFDEDGTKQHNRDPPIQDGEDERQHRKIITERLFRAGSSSFENEATSSKERSAAITEESVSITEKLFQTESSNSEDETKCKESSKEIKANVLTLESSTRDEKEEPFESCGIDATGTTAQEINNNNTKEHEKISSKLHVESNHTRRKISIPFLKGGRRKK